MAGLDLARPGLVSEADRDSPGTITSVGRGGILHLTTPSMIDVPGGLISIQKVWPFKSESVPRAYFTNGSKCAA